MNAHTRTTFRTALPWPVVAGALMVGAFLMTLALQATQARWLGWVALLPLFLAIQTLSPVRCALAGGFWGLCLGTFSALSPQSPIDISLESFGFMTLVSAVYGLLGAHMTLRVGFSPLLLAIGWVGVEFALTPLTRHHGLLACTQGDGLFIRTVGQLAGYMLVAFLIAYVNATILEILTTVCGQLVSSRPRVRASVANVCVAVGLWALPQRRLQTCAAPRAPPRCLNHAN